MQTKISKYSPNDAQTVSDLICRCLREVNSKDYSADTIDHLLNEFSISNLPTWLAKMNEVIVLKSEKLILATGSLENNRIRSVFVLPNEQNKGYGTKIMNQLENVAQEKGHDSILLDSSLSSLEFYLKRGYVENERFRNQKGCEMFAMSKSIVRPHGL